MNVQGTTGSTAPRPVAKSPDVDPRLKSIDRQIETIKKSMKTLRENKTMDQSAISAKIKEYEQRLQALEQQKQQIMVEMRKEKLTPSQDGGGKSVNPQSVENADEQTAALPDADMQDQFTRFETFKRTSDSLGATREKLVGELRIAESKSYLRDPDPVGAQNAKEKLAKLDGALLREAGELLEQDSQASPVPDSDRVAELDRISPSEAEKEPAAPKEEEQRDSLNPTGGTGRMEAGQFVDLLG